MCECLTCRSLRKLVEWLDVTENMTSLSFLSHTADHDLLFVSYYSNSGVSVPTILSQFLKPDSEPKNMLFSNTSAFAKVVSYAAIGTQARRRGRRLRGCLFEDLGSTKGWCCGTEGHRAGNVANGSLRSVLLLRCSQDLFR
jgi:hypothetical protein